MNGFIRLVGIGVLTAAIGCATGSTSDDDISLGDDATAAATADKSAPDQAATEQQAPADDLGATPAPEVSPTDTAAAPADEFNEFKDEAATPAAPAEPAPGDLPLSPEPAPLAPPTQAGNEPMPLAEPTPSPSPSAPSTAPVEITALKFKGNDNGGTLVVEATGPMSYTTRSNPDNKQFIIEIANSTLPAKLKRNLNTKDIEGSVGSIDAYQNPGSNTSRIVLQLRDGAPEPAIQAEGRSLLIVASGVQPPASAAQETAANAAATPPGASAAPPVSIDGGPASADAVDGSGEHKILNNLTVQEFLTGNMKFYGQPVNVEVDNIDVKEALKFIANESGLNLVIAESVTGKVSLKLQNVPWDQALVVLMKAKRLAYVRQGSVIRIESLEELKKEEDDATKSVKAKESTDILKVQVFPISYAKVDDLSKSLKDFLSTRGKIVADAGTASLIVTDNGDSIERIKKLIAALDIQPSQVMIEGKIVEASETFSRQVGVSWGLTGAQPTPVSNGKQGPVTFTPNLEITPSGTVTSGTGLNFGVKLGVLDFFGNLDANLRLSETENTVKIISAPHVVVLNNQPAKINQTTQLPYTTSNVLAGGGVAAKVEFKPLQLELEVTPQITADGSVLMQVHVQREVQTPGTANDGLFGVSSRTANTKILIKNGQTAVIGGIYQSDVTESEQRVPGLGSLPFIGGLFRFNKKDNNKLELLIFLTPRIINGAQVGTDSRTL